jgi:hypothetical protein
MIVVKVAEKVFGDARNVAVVEGVDDETGVCYFLVKRTIRLDERSFVGELSRFVHYYMSVRNFN